MSKVPGYLRHSSGQARTVINGRSYYLGQYNSKASKQRYDTLIAEYLASSRNPSFGIEAAELTIADLILAYMAYAKRYYGTDSNSEVYRFKYALRPLNRLYSKLPICDFSPAQFKAVRQEFIKQDMARTSINAQMRRILRMVKWGASEGMLPASIYETLRLIPGLRFGRAQAREADAVKPVELDRVEQTLPHCSKVVADMIKVQLLLGCRPGEVCKLAPGMIDRSKDVWEAKLVQHKTAHRGKERIIFIGPKAQTILKPYLLRGESDRLFRPCDAVKQQLAARERNTPINQGNRPGYNKTSREGRKSRKPGSSYNSQSYAKAIRHGA
jgi:integrase